MRATRAMFGAFGAGVSLAIAASVALLVVSSVVAFRGWPENASAPSDPEVAQLKANRADAKRSAGTETVSLPKAAAPRRAVRWRRRGGTSRAGTAATQTATATQTTSGGQSPQTGSAGQSTDAAGQTGGGASVLSAKTNVTKPVTDAVRDTTTAVADTVAPVAPAVAGALESVGAAGADAVDRVGQTADQVVGNALGN